MKKLLLTLFAFALISGGNLIPASADRPFYGDISACQSVANAVKGTCVMVSVPASLVVRN